MRKLLRDRNFRRLLAGQSLTMFGDIAMFLVLGIWVKQLTGSSGAAGVVFLVMAAPSVVAPLGGVVVDRLPRRWVMIVTDLATAAVVLSLLAVRTRADVWLIYVVAGIYGLSQQVFFAARSGLLVSMLDDERLGEANSVLESIRQGLRLGGPIVGAALFAARGGGAVAVLDAATFVASAGFLATLRFPDLARRSPSESGREPLLREISAGIRHIRRTPEIFRVVWVFVLALTVVGFLEAAIFSLTDVGLRRPPSFVGVIVSVQGVGSILGGLAAPWMMRRLDESRTIAVGLVLGGAGLGGLVFATMASVMAGVVVFGFGLTVLLVGYMTLLQRRTSNELQGRVFSAAEAVYAAPYTLSLALGAALVTVIGFKVMYAANAVVLGFMGALMLALARRDGRDVAALEVAGAVAPVAVALPVPAEAARERDPLRP